MPLGGGGAQQGVGGRQLGDSSRQQNNGGRQQGDCRAQLGDGGVQLEGSGSQEGVGSRRTMLLELRCRHSEKPHSASECPLGATDNNKSRYAFCVLLQRSSCLNT